MNDKITVTSWYDNNSVYGNANKMSSLTALEEGTNIHIDWLRIAYEQVEVMLASGKYPDFFYSYMDANNLYYLGVEGRLLADLNDYINPYMPFLNAIFAEYPTAKKVVTEINDEIYNMPRLAFTTNTMKYTDKENDVITNKYNTEISTYVKNIQAQFIAGVTPFTEWDNYCKEIEKMGIADVIAAYHSAYGRWNS